MVLIPWNLAISLVLPALVSAEVSLDTPAIFKGKSKSHPDLL